MTSTPGNVPLPENTHPFISTTLAWDNIDRLEETVHGAGTSHCVNEIVVQARHFGSFLLTRSMESILFCILTFCAGTMASFTILDAILGLDRDSAGTLASFQGKQLRTPSFINKTDHPLMFRV